MAGCVVEKKFWIGVSFCVRRTAVCVKENSLCAVVVLSI